MGLVFFCQGCGSRFDVDPSQAGQSIPCEQCGRRVAIPSSEDLATTPPESPQPAFTDVGLKPIPLDESFVVPEPTVLPDPLADAEDSNPYPLAEPESVPPVLQPSSPVSARKIAWRHAMTSLQKPFRWLNDAAYLVSVPFLMLILVGTITRSRPLAVLGATATVLLNAGRLGTGLVNLVLVPFREGIVSGVLFLVPFVTPVYLTRHWSQMRKATLRVVEPIATVGLVVVAFTFIPWLRRDGPTPSPGNLGMRLKAGAEALEADVRDEVGKVESQGLKALDPRTASPPTPIPTHDPPATPRPGRHRR